MPFASPAEQQPLTLTWIHEYLGPNPYSDDPIVVGTVRHPASADLTGLCAALPVLWASAHLRETPPEWTLVDPTRTDSALLITVSITAWALALSNEVRGYVRSAGAARCTEDRIELFLGYHHAGLSRSLIESGFAWLSQLATAAIDARQVSQAVGQYLTHARQLHPDYQARILMVGASASDVPVRLAFPNTRYWLFGQGARSRLFFESASNQDGMIGTQLGNHKILGKSVMATLGLPTPTHRILENEASIADALHAVGTPSVIKPVASGGGRGVTAQIQSLEEAVAAFRHAKEVSGQQQVIMETLIPGDDHRLMVIDGRLSAVIRREPASVVGDGNQTLEQLIATLNQERTRNLVVSRYHRVIAKDAVLTRHLDAQGLSLATVPRPGQRVTLRSNANLSTGGVTTDLSGACHPEIRAMAEHLASAVGLATLGLDCITVDISQPLAVTGGAFIEFNTIPGLDACVAAGWSEAEIAALVLGTQPGRIPVDALIGPAADLRRQRPALSVGNADPNGQAGSVGHTLVCPDGWWLNGQWMGVPGGLHQSVHAALLNQQVSAVTIHMPVEDIPTQGLPIDRFNRVDWIGDSKETLPEVWRNTIDRITSPAP